MTTHIRLTVWSLLKLWKCIGVHPWDRLLLWRKTLNLYVSFLAFTDAARPDDQLRGAMICALLSAVYDYETDWVPDSNGTYFRKLARELVDDPEVVAHAWRLFETDSARQLSRDGLERGSAALLFYHRVIRSEWMSEFSEEQLTQYGRKLQIIDDALDFKKDQLRGDLNCFLLDDRARYIAEGREFLESDFFEQLQCNSMIYRSLKKTTLRRFHDLCGDATPMSLLRATRPTTNLYAFVLTVISFRFFAETPWIVVALSAAVFYLITASIMVFNDLVDRNHDCRKGKCFAFEHPRELRLLWWWLNGGTFILLCIISWWSVSLSVFGAVVWLVGLFYSLVPGWFVFNNLIVAVCAASPALGGLAYHHTMNTAAIMTFLLLFFLILQNEVYKDIEDREVDTGYKRTIPTQLGTLNALFLQIGMLFLPAIVTVAHPYPAVVVVGVIALPVIAFQQARALLRPCLIGAVKGTMRATLICLLLALLIRPA